MRTIILLFFASITLSAQTDYNKHEDSDPKAISIIESIKDDFESYDAHKFEFSLDIEYPGHEGQNMSGHLIQSGEKFVLDMDERKIISDNQSVWVFLKERNEVQINDADFDEESDLMKPSDLFKLYNSGKFAFALSFVGKENGQAINQIECKPLDDDSEYSKMRITINERDNVINRMKIFFKDGSRMTMTIADHIRGFETSDKTFVFNEADYKDVTVEDLRF